MTDFRYSNEIFAQVVLVCHFNPDSVRVALYLIASDGYSLVTICLSSAVFTRNDRTDCVHDVLEAHGQVVEHVQVVGRKSNEQDLARQFDFTFQGIQTEGDDTLLIFVSPVFFLPRLKAICFTNRLDRKIDYSPGGARRAN